MEDLINRQAAIDAINHICPVDTEYDCTLLDRADVRYVLSDLPSADTGLDEWCTDCKEYDMGKHIVETEDLGELVRCKDCEHYWASAELCTKWTRHCGGMGYCDDAERKEDG